MDLETRARQATDEALRMPRDLEAGLAGLYRTRRRRALGKAVTAAVVMALALAGALTGHNLGHAPQPAGPTKIIKVAKGSLFGGSPTGEGYGFGSVWVSVQGGWVDRYNAVTGQLVASISVPTHPDGVVQGFGSMWVTYIDTGKVARIDPATNALLATIRVGKDPAQLAAAGGGMWIATEKAAVKIDPATNTVVARTPIPRSDTQRQSLAAYDLRSLDASSHGVWVTTGSENILRLRPSDGQILATIPVSIVPHTYPVAIVVDGNNVWVLASRWPPNALGPSATNRLVDISTATDKIIQNVQAGGDRVSSFLPGNNSLLILSDDDQDHTSELIRMDWPYHAVTSTRPLGGAYEGFIDIQGQLWIPHNRTLEIFPDS
jgi:hypothetical protein